MIDLSGLPTVTAPVLVKDERGEHRAVTNAITWVKRDDVREALLAELDRLQRMDDASVIPLTFIDALMAIRRWAGGDQ